MRQLGNPGSLENGR